jgi:predicted transcriptional regulator
MTELLEMAIAKLKELPEADQDMAAEVLISIMSKKDEPVQLDDETRAAVRRGIEQADSGEFISDEDMAAFFARHR